MHIRNFRNQVTKKFRVFAPLEWSCGVGRIFTCKERQRACQKNQQNPKYSECEKIAFHNLLHPFTDDILIFGARKGKIK